MRNFWVEYLFLCSQNHSLETGRETGEGGLQQCLVGDAVLLKPVEERSRRVDHLRLLHDHHTLEVGVHSARSQVGPDGNVCVVAVTSVLVVDATEPLVEEVVEAFVDVVRLAHDDCVALYGRVADGSYRVDLEGERKNSV